MTSPGQGNTSRTKTATTTSKAPESDLVELEPDVGVDVDSETLLQELSSGRRRLLNAAYDHVVGVRMSEAAPALTLPNPCKDGLPLPRMEMDVVVRGHAVGSKPNGR